MPQAPRSFGPTARVDLAVINNPRVATFDPGSVEGAKRRERSRRELEKYREHMAMRDDLIIEALASGITEYEAEEISGIARSTIRRIVTRAREIPS
jgi:hypothetical protein